LPLPIAECRLLIQSWEKSIIILPLKGPGSWIQSLFSPVAGQTQTQLCSAFSYGIFIAISYIGGNPEKSKPF